MDLPPESTNCKLKLLPKSVPLKKNKELFRLYAIRKRLDNKFCKNEEIKTKVETRI